MGAKYQYEWVALDAAYRASLVFAGYSDPAEVVAPSGRSHSRVMWNVSGGPDEMGPLIVSEAEIQIHDAAGAVAEDVTESVVLLIERDTGAGYAPYWQGPCEPTLSRRSADQFGNVTVLRAADGVGRLQGVTAEDLFGGTPTDISVAEAIHTICQQIFAADVVLASNWYHYKQTGAQLAAADDPLLEYTFHPGLFYPASSEAFLWRRWNDYRRTLDAPDRTGVIYAHFIFSQLLTLFGLQYFQYAGRHYVVQRELLEAGAYDAWVYPAVWGASSPEAITTDVTVPSPHYLYLEAGGAWSRAEPYAYAGVLYSHGQTSRGLLGDGGGGTFGGSFTGGYAAGWNKPGLATTVQGVPGFEGMASQGIYVADNTQTNKLLPSAAVADSEQTLTRTGSAIVAGTGALRFEFPVRAKVSPLLADILRRSYFIFAEVKVGAYWLQADGSWSNTGTAADNVLMWSLMPPTLDYQIKGLTSSSPVPATGDLFIALWQPVLRENAAAATDEQILFGSIKITFRPGDEAEPDATVTVAHAAGAGTAVGREPVTLLLGSGPFIATAGSLIDSNGDIVTDLQRGPVTGAASGVTLHGMVTESWVNRRRLRPAEHEGTYNAWAGVLEPIEIVHTPVVDSVRLALTALERDLAEATSQIRAVAPVRSGDAVTYDTVLQDGATGETTGGSAPSPGETIDTGTEVSNRVTQDPLTLTTAPVAAGAQTTVSITAYGGAEIRLFDNDTFVLVALDTGRRYLLQVNDGAHVGPAATAITFDSTAFDRPIPTGSAIYLAQRTLMTNALRGGGTVERALTVLQQGTATEAFKVDASGNVVVGAVGAGLVNLLLAVAGTLALRLNTTALLTAQTTGVLDLAATLNALTGALLKSNSYAAGTAGYQIADDGTAQMKDLALWNQKATSGQRIATFTTTGALTLYNRLVTELIYTPFAIPVGALIMGRDGSKQAETAGIQAADVVTAGVNLTTDKFALGNAGNRTVKAGTTGPADYYLKTETYSQSETDTAIATAVGGAGNVTTSDPDLSGLLVGNGGTDIDDTGIDPSDLTLKSDGVTGTFTTTDGKTVTVTDGQITDIV